MLSRSPDWLDPTKLAIGFGVHTLCMVMGTFLVARATQAGRVRQAA